MATDRRADRRRCHLLGRAVVTGVVLAAAAATGCTSVAPVVDATDDGVGTQAAASVPSATSPSSTPATPGLPSPTPSPAVSPTSSATPTPSPSPTPSPTPAPTHRVVITSEPDGADVTVTPAAGEARTGTTPMEADVPAGRATVRLEHEGRQPLTRTIDITGDTERDFHLDPAGQLHHLLHTFETGSAPKQVAFTPDGTEIWVTLLGGPGVAVHDARTGERLATIDLADHGAVELVFTADGATAWASQMESASVFEIDAATYEVTRQLPTNGTWTKVLALGPDEQRLFASNWISNDVSEIDLTTGDVVRTIPTVATPRGLYVTAEGTTLYVAGYDDGELERIDLATGDSEVLVRTDRSLRHLVGDGETLYASDLAGDAVYVHDLATDEVEKLADTDITPNTIDLGGNGRVLYVSHRGTNNPESYYLPGPDWGSIVAYDTATGQPLDAIVGGNQPTGLDVSDDGRLLAFSDFLDDRVQVYEVPPYRVLADGDGGYFGPHHDELDK